MVEVSSIGQKCWEEGVQRRIGSGIGDSNVWMVREVKMRCGTVLKVENVTWNK